MRLTCALLVAMTAMTATPAAAQPLDDNDYSVDLVNTPVLGGGRILGLGGAYTALADGVDGALWNPAAYGSRTLWELDWFEWELTAGLLFPSDDFYNRGEPVGDTDFFLLSLGFRLQFGDIGLGALPRVLSYTLGDPSTGEPTAEVSFGTGNYGLAFQLLDGQLVIGVGVRLGDLTVLDEDGNELTVGGIGPELGMLLKLEGQPWRLGVATRTEVTSDPCEPDDPQCTVWERSRWARPRNVHLPWELQVGFAVQIGERPLNRRFIDPEIAERAIEDEVTLARVERERAQIERELVARGEKVPAGDDPYRWLPRRPEDDAFWRREEQVREQENEAIDERIDAAEDAADAEVAALPRLYLLLTADLLVTGPTADGVGIDGFVDQQRVPAGEDITYSVRFGVEGEPWAGRLKLRAGTYLEPSRYTDGSSRVHGTAGLDLRLFSWDVFGLFDDFDIRVGGTIDVAERYLDWGIGVGVWH